METTEIKSKILLSVNAAAVNVTTATIRRTYPTSRKIFDENEEDNKRRYISNGWLSMGGFFSGEIHSNLFCPMLN